MLCRPGPESTRSTLITIPADHGLAPQDGALIVKVLSGL